AGRLGTVGAVAVRLLFDYRFAVVFLIALLGEGRLLTRPTMSFWLWYLDGGLTRLAATDLMLAAMRERSFVVAIVYIKTEPVQVALFGLLFLGVGVMPMIAPDIVIATAGVIVTSTDDGLLGCASGGGRWQRVLGLAA